MSDDLLCRSLLVIMTETVEVQPLNQSSFRSNPRAVAFSLVTLGTKTLVASIDLLILVK